MSKQVKIYMCGITWQHEIGETKVSVYGSVESLKEYEDCHKHGCGIVEAIVTLDRWVEKQDMKKMLGKQDDKR